MESISLKTKKQYQSFLRELKLIASRVEFTVLAKDKTPDQKFITYIEKAVLIKNDNKQNKGLKRKGVHGSTIYKLLFDDELFELLSSFSNIFIIENKLEENIISNDTKRFKLRVKPTEFGFTDLSFYDSSNELIVYSITHEGELSVDVEKHPQFKKFIVEAMVGELSLF